MIEVSALQNFVLGASKQLAGAEGLTPRSGAVQVDTSLLREESTTGRI